VRRRPRRIKCVCHRAIADRMHSSAIENELWDLGNGHTVSKGSNAASSSGSVLVAEQQALSEADTNARCKRWRRGELHDTSPKLDDPVYVNGRGRRVSSIRPGCFANLTHLSREVDRVAGVANRGVGH